MDYLAKLHWEAIVQQHLDPHSDKTREVIIEFNRALDVAIDKIFNTGEEILDQLGEPPK